MEVPSYLLQKCPLVLENSFKITLVCQHLASIPFLCSLVPQHERNGPPNPNAPDPVSSDWDSPLFHSCVLDRNHKLHGADPSSSTHTATIWPTPTQHSTVQGQSHAYIHMQALPPPLGSLVLLSFLLFPKHSCLLFYWISLSQCLRVFCSPLDLKGGIFLLELELILCGICPSWLMGRLPDVLHTTGSSPYLYLLSLGTWSWLASNESDYGRGTDEHSTSKPPLAAKFARWNEWSGLVPVPGPRRAKAVRHKRPSCIGGIELLPAQPHIFLCVDWGSVASNAIISMELGKSGNTFSRSKTTSWKNHYSKRGLISLSWQRAI